MKNNFSTRIIIATLLCALLVYTGRATRVFALAQPIETVEPVYETEVIALYEYVSENLEQNIPQLDIFFLLSGALAVAQLGAQDAMLETPYPNETSVKEWLINCGIQLYNAVIGLVPEGDYYMGIPSVGMETRIKGIPRQTIKALVAQMMGNAVVARNYPDVDSYLNDNNRPDMPLNRDVQKSINAIWQLQGGPFKWQFNTKPFETTLTYNKVTLTGSLLTSYNNYLSNVPSPHVRANRSDVNYKNIMLGASNFSTYHNLFYNTSNHTFYFMSDSGQTYESWFSTKYVLYDGTSVVYNSDSYRLNSRYLSNWDTFDTIADAVRYFFNNFNQGYTTIFIGDFIDHVYVGTNWINKNEIFNITGLNIDEDMNDYYRSPDSDVFYDIKELIQNLVNKQSIWDFFLDHLFDIDGNLIIPNFPTFSVDLTPIIELMDPPIPVNLNDIALYTDNDYLEEVKERSRKFGETIGEYFVFWHNSDPVTVYVIFGSFIVVLVGAFIGKWGHS